MRVRLCLSVLCVQLEMATLAAAAALPPRHEQQHHQRQENSRSPEQAGIDGVDIGQRRDDDDGDDPVVAVDVFDDERFDAVAFVNEMFPTGERNDIDTASVVLVHTALGRARTVGGERDGRGRNGFLFLLLLFNAFKSCFFSSRALFFSLRSKKIK